MNIFRITALLFLAGLAAAPLLRADEVVLRDGTHLKGTITIEAGRVIISQSNGSKIVFPSNQVVSLHRSPAPAATSASEPATATATKPGVEFWPPRRGERYPNLTLYDHRGRLISLGSLRGKVILLEPVGMTCEACQSLSGAGKVGCFGHQSAQAGVSALEDYFPLYAGGISLSDPRIAYVQVLLYGLDLHAPSPADAKAWAHHFKFDERSNVYVLAGTPELIGPASYAMIPGFQLIDKNFVLRAWWYGDTSTGDNLWTKLLPMVPQLLDETH